MLSAALDRAWGTATAALERLRGAGLLLLPLALVAAGVLVPLVYLGVRALAADPVEVARLVFRARTLTLLGNTAALTLGVLGLATAVALPLAWLVARTDLKGRRLVTVLGVLPLAVPGYVLAYTLLGIGGEVGVSAQLFGVVVPRVSGWSGATLALGLYTAPYLFLNLRAALLGLEASQVEAARALGASPSEAFRRITLPQLGPAFGAGALLVGLHVLGDFGVVSLMRFETLSYALYLQYTAAFSRTYAAVLALLLLLPALAALGAEARLLRGRKYARIGSGTARRGVPVALGRWAPVAYGFVALVVLAGVVVPLGTLGVWLAEGVEAPVWGRLLGSAGHAVQAAAPAALVAAGLALPLAYLGVRRGGPGGALAERTAYLGYATPPLALALAFGVFALNALPVLYQTLALLIAAYVIHFLAEAIGPVRTALYQAPPQLQEAARALGRSPFRAFWEVTVPLLRRGLATSAAFVFIACLKELPITLLLAPAGFDTLAVRTWTYANEALFTEAAPFALALVAVSAGAVALLVRDERS